MSYITQSEIETAFGENELIDLADRDADGIADTDVVQAAIDRATGVIDSYLRSRFTLPLPSTPDLVREIALSLSRHFLATGQATDRTKDDYRQALGWLKDIRDGKMDVGLDATDTDVAPTSGGPQFSRGSGAFDEADLAAFGWKR